MMTKNHMQDQITNRIEAFMNDNSRIDFDEILQTVVTLTTVAAFLLLGLNW